MEETKITIEYMEKEKEKSLSVPFTDYNTNKSTPGCLFCFVEGKTDSDYYLSKIKNIYGSNFSFVPCYNKKNVLEMYKMIYEADKDTKKLAFFIDHDFDDKISLEGVYETECYSIENYYTYEDAFSEFIQFGLHISKNSPEYQKMMNFYTNEFDKFHDVVLEFNAWIAACKAKNNKNEMIHLNILGTSIPKVFLEKEIGGKYNQKYNLETLNNYFDAIPKITKEEHRMMIKRIKGKNYYMLFRGKYEIHFLNELLLYIQKEANKKKKDCRDLCEKSIVSWNICTNKLMIYYSDYAYIPQSLKDFISTYVA